MVEQDEVGSLEADSGEESVEAPKQGGVNDDDVASNLRSAIEESKRYNRTFHQRRKRNVETLMGNVPTDTDGVGAGGEDRQVELNPDWSLVKTKRANLYSQVPQVQLAHENEQYAGAIFPFGKALNYELGPKRSNVGVAMEEVLTDVINAAGIGGVVVGYTALFDDVEMPVADSLPGPNGPMPVSQIPPQTLDAIMQRAKETGIPIPTKMVKRTTDDKLFCSRISPNRLLWSKAFKGSNFDDADWVGYTGECGWAEGKNEFGLTDDQKDQVIGETDNLGQDDLRVDTKSSGPIESSKMKYDVAYYWRCRVDPDCKSFKAIWKIVFVHGIDKPVKHEAWEGQRYDQQTGKYVGSCKYPVRFLTLTYVSDNAVPPSDTAAGRPQVEDLRRSRSLMFKHRERAFGLRWVDTTRVDPIILDLLQRGEIDGFVPTLGDGSRSIGEIARSQFAPEDRSFDIQTKADLMESWQIGQNQNSGAAEPGRKTGTQVTTEQNNFATRIGQERGKVLSFFTGICEVLAGWMVLYSDFPNLTEQERQVMQQAWDDKHILHDLVMKIHPDAAITMDVQTQIARKVQFLNITGKSGYTTPEPTIREIAELSGEDPSKVMIKPQPKNEDPNVSFRFSGKDDMINVMVVATLIAKGKAPTKQHIDQARELLAYAAIPPTPQAGLPGQPPAPLPGQAPVHPQHVSTNENWELMPTVAKRQEDI